MHTVFKKGDSTDKSNYRPLQMLSIPSKILEATVCRNIDSFTNDCGLCNENQWGFTKGKSTEGLLTYLTEKWKTALDNGNVVGVVFIDFKKAFDCVSHSILDLKLQAMGISGPPLEWIRDYLKDRKQFAVVNGCRSELNAVNCGIPQGSLLGPRLFSFYVNDLPDQIKEGEIDMYADDTTLFYIGPSVDAVCDGLNRILGDVHNWCRNNKLTTHSGKSEVMVINRNSTIGPLKPVSFGNKILSYVNTSTCLGVVIDSKLSWQPQITAVCKTFSQKVKYLKRLRVLPKKVLEAIYFRSIVPSATYGILVWGTCSPALLHNVERIHLRAAKIIYSLADVNLETLKYISWQPLMNVYKLKLTSLMYSVYHGLAPKSICDLFHKTEPRRYLLRRAEGFNVPKYNYSIGRTSLSYRGPTAWNILPEPLKLIDSYAGILWGIFSFIFLLIFFLLICF